MLEFLQDFFLNFSFVGKYNIMNDMDLESIPILYLIAMIIFLLSNIAHFWDSWDSNDYNPWIYIGGIITYLIINTIFLTIVSLIAMSIFAIIGFFVVWILLLIICIIAAANDEDGEDASMFALIPRTKLYAKLISQFIKYRRDTRKNYNNFLNFKY